MRVVDLVKRSARSLGNAKVRTALTALAIAVGAFTLTLALAAGQGIRNYSEKLVSSNFDPRELIVAKDKRIFGGDAGALNTPQEYKENTSADKLRLELLTEQDVAAIRQTKGVEEVREAYQLSPLYIKGVSATRYTAQVQSYNAGQKPEVLSGATPNELAADGILIPESYVKVLGYGSADKAIGQTLTATFRRDAKLDPAEIQRIFLTEGQAGLEAIQRYETLDKTFHIVGVIKESVTSFTTQMSLFVASSAAKEIDDFTNKNSDTYHKYQVIYVRAADGEDQDKRAVVQKTLEDKGYKVQSVEDTQAFLNTIIDVLQGIVLVFGAITLVASVFGIINTQYISVLERTREIGLQKALGMRRWDITLLFLIEAAWIGLLGGLLGSLAAWALGTALNPTLTEMLGIGEGNSILVFVLSPIVVLIILLIVIAMAAGLFPALKAAKLDPIEALRTE